MFPETKSIQQNIRSSKTSGRDTFEFDEGQVTKNQPITVLVLLSESLGI